MDKVLLEKLARALLDKDEVEKTAEMDKMAELQASYELGQYTADAFIDEFNKIAELANSQDETEKIAAVYDDYGRAMARDYFASLMKKAEEEKEEGEKEEPKEEEKEESKEEPKEEKKEESKEESKEEKKDLPPWLKKEEEKKASLQKKASAKDRLVAALKQLK